MWNLILSFFWKILALHENAKYNVQKRYRYLSLVYKSKLETQNGRLSANLIYLHVYRISFLQPNDFILEANIDNSKNTRQNELIALDFISKYIFNCPL